MNHCKWLISYGETIRYLTIEELYQFLDGIEDYGHKFMMRMIYELGCRVGEFVRIQLKHLAFDRATGELVWERTARTAVPHEGTHRTATWASASAVTDGEILVASFGSNGLYAYDLDGKLLWERDLGDQTTVSLLPNARLSKTDVFPLTPICYRVFRSISSTAL